MHRLITIIHANFILLFCQFFCTAFEFPSDSKCVRNDHCLIKVRFCLAFSNRTINFKKLLFFSCFYNTLKLQLQEEARREKMLFNLELERWRGNTSHKFLWFLFRFLLWQRWQRIHGENGKAEKNLFVLMLNCAFSFLTALVTWDHQRDIWRRHFYLKNATASVHFRSIFFYESHSADETVVIVERSRARWIFVREHFYVSSGKRRVCYLSHIFDWQIKLYLFTPEFNFMSDKQREKRTTERGEKSQTFFFLLRRIPERKKKFSNLHGENVILIWCLAIGLELENFYKFIFFLFHFVWFFPPFVKRVLSHHSILWFLIYSLKEF